MRDVWEVFNQGILAHPMLKMTMRLRSCEVSGNSSEFGTPLVDGGDKLWTFGCPCIT